MPLVLLYMTKDAAQVECWEVKSQQNDKIHIVNTRMFHWMSIHTKQ